MSSIAFTPGLSGQATASPAQLSANPAPKRGVCLPRRRPDVFHRGLPFLARQVAQVFERRSMRKSLTRFRFEVRRQVSPDDRIEFVQAKPTAETRKILREGCPMLVMSIQEADIRGRRLLSHSEILNR